MKRYQLARLEIRRKLQTSKDVNGNEKWPSIGRIQLSCTDPKILEWFAIEMQSTFGSLSSQSKYTRQYPDSEETYSCLIEFKDSKNGILDAAEQIEWWLLRGLCETGWEPYSGKTYFEYGSLGSGVDRIGNVYYLRFEQDI